MKNRKIRRSLELCVEQLEARVVPATVNPAIPPAPYALWASSNWSGIDLDTTKGAVTAVSGSWVVPSAGPAQKLGTSATWVGMDGDISGTVEQIGTESDTAKAGSMPQYFAWFEMYPAGWYYVTMPSGAKATVNAGDHISASVVYGLTAVKGSTATNFTLSIADTPAAPTLADPGWNFSTVQSLSHGQTAQRNSAEWIEEKDSGSLANFGSVTFSDTQATIGSSSGTIASFVGQSDIMNYGTAKTGPLEINIFDVESSSRSGTTIGDETSLLTSGSGGDSFTIQFGSSATGPGGIGLYGPNDRVTGLEAIAPLAATQNPAAVPSITLSANTSSAAVHDFSLVGMASLPEVSSNVPSTNFADTGAIANWTTAAFLKHEPGFGVASPPWGSLAGATAGPAPAPAVLRMAVDGDTLYLPVPGVEVGTTAEQPPVNAFDNTVERSATGMAMLAAALLGWNPPAMQPRRNLSSNGQRDQRKSRFPATDR